MSCSQQETRKIDHLLEKNTLLDYKYIDVTWSPYWVSFIGLRHDFGQKIENIHYVCFWTIKICILQSHHTEFFSKGLTHDFDQKCKISY